MFKKGSFEINFGPSKYQQLIIIYSYAEAFRYIQFLEALESYIHGDLFSEKINYLSYIKSW